jgi:hypothetical protein
MLRRAVAEGLFGEADNAIDAGQIVVFHDLTIELNVGHGYHLPTVGIVEADGPGDVIPSKRGFRFEATAAASLTPRSAR